MKKTAWFIVALMVIGGAFSILSAAERGGKEHGGKEQGGIGHAGKKVAEPTASDIHKEMKAYFKEKTKGTGTFDVFDPEVAKTRKLSLVRFHERIGKTGNYYYSCADFKDTETGQMLDLDLDVEQRDSELKVVDVRIHKVNGKERYTYDENDKRIPVE